MRAFELILRFPGGGSLIGGQTGHVAGAHVVHAKDRAGLPLIPSTAIRGALRESLEALLRATGQNACVGGDGRAPSAEPASGSTMERGPCRLDNGGRCVPCQLFGSPRSRLDPGEAAFSGLVIGPARLQSKHMDWYTRPSVSIDRRRRSARDQALVFQRVPAGRDLCFVARGRLRIPELSTRLEAAVRATTHVGADRSRGLGHVDMTLCWHDEESLPGISLPEGDVYLRMVLDSPASFGVAVVERNFRDTRTVVPGSALRGAVGFALAELVADINEDAAFQALVDSEHGAHFGFLHPVDAHAAPSAVASVLPITAQACKREGRTHGVVDVFLDRLVLSLADSAERAAGAHALFTSQCARCQSPLRNISGSRRAGAAPRIRAVTRMAMDRARGSARDEHLFTEILIEAGTHFEGTIRNVPVAARERLAQALGSGLISLGRGRAMGWGQVRLGSGSASPAVPRVPVTERGAAFECAFGERLRSVGAPAMWAPRLVPVTLLSPLVPMRDDDEDGERLLMAALGGQKCKLKMRRFAREGSWDQSGKGMEARLAVAAGGVFVIDLGQGTSWHDITSRIEEIEKYGVGERRYQGFGQVICFDPLFLTGQPALQNADSEKREQEHDRMESVRDDNMDISQRLRPHRKDLVMAAENAMKGVPGAGRAGKSQLNRLVSVCNEAECAEEIENYLRYQAGRSSSESFWTITLVKKVIDEMNQVFAKLPGDGDAFRVAAWRLYAVYMTRAFTYEDKRAKEKASGGKPARGADGRRR